MAYTKQHSFDRAVINRMRSYIEGNNLSLSKIAKASGIPYQRLYHLLYNSQLIKLREYVALCQTFKEPLDFFVHGINYPYEK